MAVAFLCYRTRPITGPSVPRIAFVLDNSARKELEQRKDDFISMASHELRNPLTVLKLQTHLAAQRNWKARASRGGSGPFQYGGASSTNSPGWWKSCWMSPRSRRAGWSIGQEMVDLDALLQEITDTMQQTHPSHRILVRGAVQTSLMADRDRLGQVFINLINNAIKYSPDAETVEWICRLPRDGYDPCAGLWPGHPARAVRQDF